MKLIFENQSKNKVSKRLFSEILKRTLIEIPNIKETELELLITTNKEIQKLNKAYRDMDKPTDVLSFAEREINDSPSNSLGQIIISIERADEQAKELNQPLSEELKFLFTHGLLHILGYDHENPKDEKIMLEKAYKILGRI